MKKQIALFVFVSLGIASTGLYVRTGNASDHDDGENDQKSRALNLTDHFVFREGDQKSGASTSNLIFIQNSNPRSLPQQQYFFSKTARYEFHVTRVTDKTKSPSGGDDVIFRFEFGANDATTLKQVITFSIVKDGSVVGSSSSTDAGTDALTTNFTNSAAGTVTSNAITLAGGTFTYFAGLREDPFFFDVERFFEVRSYLIGTYVNSTSPSLAAACAAGGAGGVFNPSSCAPDFTKGYNVNSIVLRVPIAFLQSGSTETTFDTWSTISVPQ